jgi:hypothetical protein
MLQTCASQGHVRSPLRPSSAEVDLAVLTIEVWFVTGSQHLYGLEANAARNCIGLITWMHTFSPAKMWIAGLSATCKPFVHLHTQFNREIPWAEIDMDFMNLNQSAHGDREYGFIGTRRMRLNRKVVVGYWQDGCAGKTGPPGCAPPAPGTIPRACVLRALATTCAKWRSPKATRSKRRCALAIRSTATASATWRTACSRCSDARRSTGW